MSPHPLTRALAAAVVASVSSVSAFALDPPRNLPGDLARVAAAPGESNVAIAEGGPGALVVWQDTRTSISGIINAAYEPLLGNQTDVYGMRLDQNGQPLDATPIVISNLGRNQTHPRVAWNGSNWLVVFVSERPDWYFFEDIVGVRVSPQGAVLDATPITIRAELNSPANYYGTNPSVGSDGVNWIVVWEDWIPASGNPAVKGTRVRNDGVVLDPTWPILHNNGNDPFGPNDPQVTFANGELLLAWRDPVYSRLRGRRLTTALVPIAPTFVIATSVATQQRPALVSDGAQHYLLADSRLFRISSTGSVLDPTGIVIPAAGVGVPQQRSAAWNGSSLSIVQSGVPVAGQDSEIFLSRMFSNGTFQDAVPFAITTHPDDDSDPVAAGSGGRTQTAFIARGHALEHFEDVRGVSVDAAGVAAPQVEVAAGLERQDWARSITAPFGHLVTFAGHSSQTTRALAQRVDASGNPIDAEPVVIATTVGTRPMFVSSAWNGSEFLLAWADQQGPVFARRYSIDLAPLDPAPVQLFATGGAPGVGALPGGDFLVASNYFFSGDQSVIHGVRIDAATGAVKDVAPFDISGSYAFDPKITPVGGRWLVTWSSKPTHDSPATSIRARFVDASGALPAPSFVLNTIGFALEHDVAVNGDRVLVTWQDNATPTDAIEGRVLDATGAFVGADFTIADEVGDQMFPTTCASGDGFVVAWVDYRSNVGVDQLRGDLYATRVTSSGAVLDGNGVQLTSGVLPEDLPDLSSSGFTYVFYDALGGDGVTSADVPRITYRRVDDFFPSHWTDVGTGESAGARGAPALVGFGDASTIGGPFSIRVAGAARDADALLVLGTNRVDAPFLGGTLVPAPTIVLPAHTDANGDITLASTWPAGVPSGFVAWFQAFVADAGAIRGAAGTNGLQLTVP